MLAGGCEHLCRFGVGTEPLLLRSLTYPYLGKLNVEKPRYSSNYFVCRLGLLFNTLIGLLRISTFSTDTAKEHEKNKVQGLTQFLQTSTFSAIECYFIRTILYWHPSTVQINKTKQKWSLIYRSSSQWQGSNKIISYHPCRHREFPATILPPELPPPDS